MKDWLCYRHVQLLVVVFSVVTGPFRFDLWSCGIKCIDLFETNQIINSKSVML